jgi:hypothetical protein
MPRPHKYLWVALFLLASCGSGEETKRPELSLAKQEPSAGMDYRAFRNHQTWGEGDMTTVQKRFIVLDRNNNGVLSPDELGGGQ